MNDGNSEPDEIKAPHIRLQEAFMTHFEESAFLPLSPRQLQVAFFLAHEWS